VDELVALERRFWLEASGELYREHAALELVMAFPDPTGIVDRETAIPMVAPWDGVALDDVRHVELAPDVAALVYRAEGRLGEAERYRAVVTSVYVRRDGRWLLALHQQTPLD
jgi:hypothetical protein